MWAPLAAALVATPAWADAGPSHVTVARAHLQMGLRHYDVHDFREAAAEFRAAYLADPRPEYLYSLGQAERAVGDCQSALISYRAYLRHAKTSTNTALVLQQIDRCQAELGAPEAAAPVRLVEDKPAPARPAGEGAPRPTPAVSLEVAPSTPSAPPAPSARRMRPRVALVVGLVTAFVGVVASAALATALLPALPRSSDFGTYSIGR
jgi:hypothetical protein